MYLLLPSHSKTRKKTRAIAGQQTNATMKKLLEAKFPVRMINNERQLRLQG
jgi:hypothetical protein